MMRIVANKTLISVMPSTDWYAHDDVRWPDCPEAYGATKAEALRNLAELYDGEEAEHILKLADEAEKEGER